MGVRWMRVYVILCVCICLFLHIHSLYMGNKLNICKASEIDYVWIMKHFLWDDKRLQRLWNKKNLHVPKNLKLKFLK